MKLKITYFLLILVTVFSSCSSDDNVDQSSEFRFLEFEKNVLLPAINTREILFLGLDFDQNLNNWELSLVNDENEAFPVNMSSIVTTPYGFKNGERVQEIKFMAPAFGNGNYSLTITNTKTGQTYTDSFLVRSAVFTQIEYQNPTFYNYTSATGLTNNLFYFHNVTNTITSAISTNNIVSVNLQNTRTFSELDLDYIINTNNKVTFIIPPAVSPGTYYVSVKYNNLINTYFEKDIVILEEKAPVINAINKNVFQAGEKLTISGNNFRYKVDFSLIPINDLLDPFPSSGLIFKDVSRSGEVFISPYKFDDSYNYINETGTEINFTIPTSQFYITGTDAEGDYFEGDVIVRSGPYVSNPISIRINY